MEAWSEWSDSRGTRHTASVFDSVVRTNNFAQLRYFEALIVDMLQWGDDMYAYYGVLLCCHLVGDSIFRAINWQRTADEGGRVIIHSFVYVLPFLPLIAMWKNDREAVLLASVLFVSHFLIDIFSRRYQPFSIPHDQVMHLVVYWCGSIISLTDTTTGLLDRHSIFHVVHFQAEQYCGIQTSCFLCSDFRSR